MILEAADNVIKQRFVARAITDILGYWRLYDYLRYHLAPGEYDEIVQFTSAQAFWHAVLRDRCARPVSRIPAPLREGQRVKLKGDFSGSEWVPKLAGQLWTINGSDQVELMLKEPAEWAWRNKNDVVLAMSPIGKRLALGAGFGSVRPARRIRRDDDYFALLAAVDVAAWHVDLGIPLVVSRPIFEDFSKVLNSSGRYAAPYISSLEGRYLLLSEPHLFDLVPEAVGGTVTPALRASLSQRPFLPRVFLHVTSPLQIRFKTNDTHPPATAWSMYLAKRADRWGDPLRFVHVGVDPSSDERLAGAALFIKDYASRFGGHEILTDFDGIIPRLDATVPLRRDPTKTAGRNALARIVQTLDRWSRKGSAGRD